MKVIMGKRIAAAAAALLLAGPALAQDAKNLPPQNARKLSEIIAKVEQRQGFRYVDEVEWSDGAYEVTYFTGDKAKVEIRYDPVTAEPK
jgi:hypothetical protein